MLPSRGAPGITPGAPLSRDVLDRDIIPPNLSITTDFQAQTDPRFSGRLQPGYAASLLDPCVVTVTVRDSAPSSASIRCIRVETSQEDIPKSMSVAKCPIQMH